MNLPRLNLPPMNGRVPLPERVVHDGEAEPWTLSVGPLRYAVNCPDDKTPKPALRMVELEQ